MVWRLSHRWRTITLPDRSRMAPRHCHVFGRPNLLSAARQHEVVVSLCRYCSHVRSALGAEVRCQCLAVALAQHANAPGEPGEELLHHQREAGQPSECRCPPPLSRCKTKTTNTDRKSDSVSVSVLTDASGRHRRIIPEPCGESTRHQCAVQTRLHALCFVCMPLLECATIFFQLIVSSLFTYCSDT